MGLFKNFKDEKNKMKETNRRNKEIFKSGDKPMLMGIMNYISGHPDSGAQTQANLYINNIGILYDCVISYNIFIPFEDIIKTEYRVDQRVLKKDCNDFLVITCTVSGIETEVVFQGKTASVVNSNILKKLQEYSKNNNANNSEKSKEGSGCDITEQIKKLSDLKEQGILTEEEFNAKKTELLSRI